MESQTLYVQELATDCDHLPERYNIYKRGYSHGATIDASSLPVLEVPVIDISLLTKSSSEPEGAAELQKLRQAFTSLGCFQAINHGMEDSFLDKVHEVGRQFFALPMEEKKKYMRTADVAEGYGTSGQRPHAKDETLDWSDRLYLLALPEDQQKPKFWPHKPHNFRETLQEYTQKVQLLNKMLLGALARSLNTDENSFLDQYGEEATIYARYNYYPPCRWPDKVLAVKPHADLSTITVLLQDREVEGLQMLKDEKWFRVPVVPNALTINAGDQLEVMSNGIFKSPMHRVSTKAEKERLTLAMFCMCQAEKEIGPVKELITNKTPRIYKNVILNLDFYTKNYQYGKRAIDGIRI